MDKEKTPIKWGKAVLLSALGCLLLFVFYPLVMGLWVNLASACGIGLFPFAQFMGADAIVMVLYNYLPWVIIPCLVFAVFMFKTRWNSKSKAFIFALVPSLFLLVFFPFNLIFISILSLGLFITAIVTYFCMAYLVARYVIYVD